MYKQIRFFHYILLQFILFLDFSGSSSVHEVATLYHSARLRNVLDKIDYFSKLVRKTDDIQGPVEADPEYILVRMSTDFNNLAFGGGYIQSNK